MSEFKTLDGTPPLIIAHRGASGVLPEHTIEAYARAIEMGADYIEPDLVITKDGHLVARHDRYLSGSTNVSDRSEFADRKVEKPGHDGADWFVEDFTLAEIKTLKARQPREGRSKAYDDLYDIPTFDDVLDLADATGVGVYPETKQPSAFAAVGLRHDEALISALESYRMNRPDAPVYIQSFELENLKRLNAITDVQLVFLTEDLPNFTAIAETVDGIGPYKKLLLDESGKDTGFVAAAHAAGLKVHPWTFRDDQLDPNFPNIDIEMKAYFDLGVDGVFSDFPDTALRVRDHLQDN